jgi:signal transduction histidine kinase/ActR/RegA family two-component response regulator
MILPLTWTWAQELSRQLDGRPWWQGPPLVLTALFMIYGALLIVLARDTWRMFRNSFESRRQLQAALDTAESANRAKTRFLASASHDLRQPMHTLSLFAAALSMRPLDDRSRAIAQQMNQALQALSSQLDVLLDVSKLDAGIVEASAADVDIRALLGRLRDEFEPAALRKGLALRAECPPSARAHTDALLLDRVLRNLLDNALKYTLHGEVVLRAGPAPDGRLQLEVVDTGPGIAAEEHERVFEEFYQLGNAERDRRQGLGLGLSIVRRLAELLGLGLRMHSAPGAGTRFCMSVAAATALPAAPAGPGIALPTLAGLKVLVIDDEEAVREGMRTLLEAYGCRVSLAGGTAGALKAAAEAPPDLVLADFRLREHDDGLLAVRQLRAQHPGLPALLVSGDTAPERLREARAAGLPLLHKPVAAEVLVLAIHKAVHGRAPDTETTRFGATP